MAGASTPYFTCPFCGKKFRWKPELAGRKVVCAACSGKMRVPAGSGAAGEPVEPPPKAEDEGYELDLPGDQPAAAASPAATSHQGKCPACNSPVKPNAVICINCGFNLADGKRIATAVHQPAADGAAAPLPAAAATPKPEVLNSALAGIGVHRGVDAAALAEDMEAQHHWKEFKLPLILVGVGLLLLIFNTAVMAPAAYSASPFAGTGGGAMIYGVFRLVLALIRFFVQLPIMLIGIVVVARIFGSSFGPIGTALLKLTAVVLVTGGADDFLTFGLDIITGGFGAMIGGIFLWAAQIGVFFVMCIAILETEVLETIVLYLILYFLPTFAIGFLTITIWAMLTP